MVLLVESITQRWGSNCIRDIPCHLVFSVSYWETVWVARGLDTFLHFWRSFGALTQIDIWKRRRNAHFVAPPFSYPVLWRTNMVTSIKIHPFGYVRLLRIWLLQTPVARWKHCTCFLKVFVSKITVTNLRINEMESIFIHLHHVSGLIRSWHTVGNRFWMTLCMCSCTAAPPRGQRSAGVATLLGSGSMQLQVCRAEAVENNLLRRISRLRT